MLSLQLLYCNILMHLSRVTAIVFCQLQSLYFSSLLISHLSICIFGMLITQQWLHQSKWYLLKVTAIGELSAVQYIGRLSRQHRLHVGNITCMIKMKQPEQTKQLYTVNVERFAQLNIHGFCPIKFFTETLSRCIGHQCLLFTYN